MQVSFAEVLKAPSTAAPGWVEGLPCLAPKCRHSNYQGKPPAKANCTEEKYQRLRKLHPELARRTVRQKSSVAPMRMAAAEPVVVPKLAARVTKAVCWDPEPICLAAPFEYISCKQRCSPRRKVILSWRLLPPWLCPFVSFGSAC
jgi:hypothetical protein